MIHSLLLTADWHGDDLRREAAARRLAADAVRVRRAAAPPRPPLTNTVATALAALLGRARGLSRAMPSGPQPCGC